MASDKALPRKLEEDLNNAKFYKPSAMNVESGAQRLAKVFDDSKERAMYDEILGPMLGSNKALPVTARAPATSNTDFNSTIIARLKHVETEAKESRQKLAEQILTNEKLLEENLLLKSMISGSTGAVDEVAKLKQQNSNLQSKIREMEAFLGDYGLVWVGNKANNDESEAEEAERSTSDIDGTETLRHTVSYSDFNFHINELNAVIYSEPTQIVIEGSNQRKARLVQSSELLENVRIVYYRNGLMIKRGPFRQCGSPGYKSFVKDIVDGYFPSEFQSEYPEGVVFDLKDQRHVDFVEGKSDSYAEDSQMSRAQLLNRLPKTVIHKGEVVGIRGDIESLLGGKGADQSTGSNSQVVPKPKVVIDTPAVNATEAPNQSMGELVQIQVKWVDQSSFIAKLYEHNTVGDLKAYIVQHFQGVAPSKSNLAETRADNKAGAEHKSQDKSHTATMTDAPGGENCISLVGALGFDFELRSAYPPRALGLFLSLKEAGLSPNGTVHARKLEY